MVTKRKSGFTLVEILIVVVILGILAAIVIPQFSNASSEARESSLVSNLQALRSQIELFKIQHQNDLKPGDDGSGGFSQALFRSHMTQETERSGSTTTDDSGDEMGPYMRTIPENPFVEADTATNLVEVEDGTGNLGGGNYHWHYDYSTGTIRADDDGQTPDETPHVDL